MRKTLGTILLGMGALGAFVTLLSIVNVAFDLNLTFGSRGAQSPLPKDWIECAGIGVFSLLSAGLGGVLSSESIARVYREQPSVKWGTILLVPVLLGLGIWQLRYLNHGGKLQWAAAEGRTDVLEEMLAEKDFDRAELAEAWFKAVHYEQVAAARVLAKAGVQLENHCEPLRTAVMRSAELAKIVIEAGADPKACREDLISLAQLGEPDDREATIRLLRERGL